MAFRRFAASASPCTSRTRRSQPLSTTSAWSSSAAASNKTAKMAEAFVALGGNVGDVRETFGRAIAMLCSDQKVSLIARSSDYRTAPWGVTDQPPFINAVIEVATDLEPHVLLSRTQDSERALGRDRAKQRHWGPRTIDLDM